MRDMSPKTIRISIFGAFFGGEKVCITHGIKYGIWKRWAMMLSFYLRIITIIIIINYVNNKMLKHDWSLTALIYGFMHGLFQVQTV